MRTLVALLTLLAIVAAAAPAPSGASLAATRACPQSDPANGIGGLRAGGLSCSKAFKVARRTNAVKCFLNGNSCTHRVRGRSWTCKLDDATLRVTCRSGGKVVKYRVG